MIFFNNTRSTRLRTMVPFLEWVAGSPLPPVRPYHPLDFALKAQNKIN